jgi:Flp pilus assembly protein TadB
MLNLETITTLTGAYGPFIAVAIATFLAAEAIFLIVVRRRRRTKGVNARLNVLARSTNRQAALIELRRARGLTSDGNYQLPLVALNQLLLQSGASLPVEKIALLMGAAGVATGIVTYILTGLIALALLAATGAGVIVNCVGCARDAGPHRVRNWHGER